MVEMVIDDAILERVSCYPELQEDHQPKLTEDAVAAEMSGEGPAALVGEEEDDEMVEIPLSDLGKAMSSSERSSEKHP